ncbi:MAG: hypothetical protein NVSMB31_13560 [Vulcanimicrobiaceae bacterium]
MLCAAFLFASGCARSTPPNAIDDLHVDAKTLAKAAQAVETSALPQNDKIAFAAMVEQHRAKPHDLDGKTVREIILQERTYEVGLRMGAQERADDKKHREAIAKLMAVTIQAHSEEEHRIVLKLRVVNKTAKAMTRFDSAIEVHDRNDKRIGIAEFVADRAVPPHQTVTFSQPISYLRFGEDAGMMRMFQRKPKTVELEVKEIKYRDGSDAGYDD